MKDILNMLLKSKRFWIVVLTGLAHVLVKYHVVLSSDTISDVADQLLLVAGSVSIVATKIQDSKVAAPAPAPAPTPASVPAPPPAPAQVLPPPNPTTTEDKK